MPSYYPRRRAVRTTTTPTVETATFYSYIYTSLLISSYRETHTLYLLATHFSSCLKINVSVLVSISPVSNKNNQHQDHLFDIRRVYIIVILADQGCCLLFFDKTTEFIYS